jgi:hypothetical protein
MSTTLRDEMAADALEPSADLGDTFRWNDTDWSCVIGEIDDQVALQEGGDFETAKFVIVTAKAQFGGDLPQQRDPIIVAGKSYIIGDPKTSPGDPLLEIPVLNEP